MDNLITTYNNQPVTSSRMVAENFEKEHKHVLRDIDNLKKDVPNFGLMFYETEIPDSYGRPQRAYFINKKGFQLLAMGFTGKKAIEWKLKYIDAFEAMEKELATPKLTPTPRYRARRLSTAMEDMEKTAANLCKMFKVNAGIAYSKAISMIEPLYGVSFDSIKDLLPAATHDIGYMNPTQVGEKFQGKSAREINLLLAGYGLQHKEGKCWRLDDAGREYGEEVPYTRNGHSGYDIRWNDKLISLLQEKETLVIEKA